MGRVEREVERARQDTAREEREERAAKARDAARTEQPKDKP
jgi:hypothetical protein